ncbi:cytochrome P450 2U1-like [Saccoglossus kowalevskii]
MTNNKAATFKRHIFLSSMRKFGMGKKSMEARIHKEICHLLEECQHNLAFDPSLNVFNSVFNVICSVTLGQRFRYSDQRFKDLTDALFKIFHLYLGVAFIFPGAASLMELVVGRKSFQSNAAFYKILEPIIDQHHETYNEDNPRDLIDVLLKMTDDLNKGNSSQNLGKKGMPFKYFYIYAMILDIFAAGAETVSSTLTWGLLYVLKHPNVQDKIQVELDSIVGRDRLPNMSDKPNLPYTEAAITEVLRMASTVPLSVPRWTANDTSLFGYLIPKNTMILPNLWNVLHEPSLWRNPEQFYPDRFLDSNGKFTRSNQYIPFGLGSRVCLGEQLAKMELFLIFAGVLQHFRLEVDAHSSPLPSLDDGFMHITLRPPKFKMRMVKR